MTARRRTTAVLVAALLGLASVGAACGDDDDDGGGEALSEAEFLEQGNAICAAGSEELDEAFEGAFESTPTAEGVKEFFDDVVIPNIRDQIDAIRDLGAPDEIDGGVDSFLDGADAKLDELGAMDADELFALMTSGEDPFAEINEQATNIGLTECADSEDGEEGEE